MQSLLAILRARPYVGDSTDRQLLDRFAAVRDEAAFAEIVHRHGPLVWGVCRRNLGDSPDAEDAFQAVFLVLVRRANRLGSHTALGPWLFQVAVWCCRNIRRGNRRRLQRVRVGLPDAAPVAEPAAEVEMSAALDAAILALPEKYRVPIILCHLQGWTRKQAAQHLGCSEGTLSARLSRALTKLRKRLSDNNPAAVLAIAGATAAPAAMATAAVRGATSDSIPNSILSTANGVLRMFRMKMLRFICVGILAAAAIGWLGTSLIAKPEPPPEKPVVPTTNAVALVAGKWILIEWMAPNAPSRVAELTVAMKDGKPAIAEVESDPLKWTAKDLTVVGRRVTFTMTRNVNFHERFDGVFDPANPKRVLGSFAYEGGRADRAVLEWVPHGTAGKLRRPELPREWQKYIDLAVADQNAHVPLDGPTFAKKTAAEQAAMRAEAAKADAAYWAELPRLFRRLVAGEPESPFGYEAAMELFGMVDRVKPSEEEVDSWAKTARTFAATHGPQFEADTVGRIATCLIRRPEYAAQARKYARVADDLAKIAGMPATFMARVAEYDAERAAWASQTKPPALDSVWTVSVTGRVTDAKGNPIPGVEVLVNNTQWVKTLTTDGSYKAKTDAEGKYSITLKCQGSYRLHITNIWAEKKGFVRVENSERHKLLPGQSEMVNFILTGGERFGGTLKLRPDAWEREIGAANNSHFLRIVGTGVEELVVVPNGGKFELTLPSGQYRLILDDGPKKREWANLKTGRIDHVLDEPPFRFTPETVGAGFDQMWQSMDRSYSYFILKPDVDWVKLRDEFRPKAIAAKSAEELAAVLTSMLGRLKDGHVWIEMPDGKIIGTHRTVWSYNGNRKIIQAQLTDATECGEYAVVGKTKPDGFGYFLMTQQSAATPELAAKAAAAIEKLADVPGFIVDLRNANGGSEPLAQEIAQLFCGEKVVYAKSRFRDGKQHDQFTDDQPRFLMPAKSGKPFLKPVVCLLGPGCVSSGEGFAKMMSALPHVTTVGLPTRGSSGNPAPVEVGETGVIVYFSQWVDLTPNGMPFEGKGIPPKIRVERPAAEYKNADPTLAKGLEVLREKRKGQQ